MHRIFSRLKLAAGGEKGPPYEYSPIQKPRHVRVVQVQPAGDLKSPLHCCMSFVCLDNYDEELGIDYTALSYSWDAQKPSSPVTVDGGTLLVTPNCEAAMRRLRSSTEVSNLWIDGICINQSRDAIEERNQQVAIMGDVYKRAKKVVIWLGESDTKMELAMRTIMHVSEDVPGVTVREEKREAMRERVGEISRNVKKTSEDPFGPLFQRSWFDRMWVIQEATIGIPSRVYVQSGKTSIPWTRLLIASDILQSVNYSWSTSTTGLKIHLGLTIYLSVVRWPRVLEILDNNPEKYHNSPLAYAVLTFAKGKKAMDPKDKVFGLYSLFRELHVEIPVPDYNKSVEQIYREATVASIKYDKLLDILYHCPSDNRRPGLRSWVPDWSDPPWAEDDSRSPLAHSKFAACGPSDARWHFNDDETNLVVVGKIFDTVMYRAETMPAGRAILQASRDGNALVSNGRQATELGNRFLDFTTQSFNILKDWWEVSQWSDYPTGESTKDAFKGVITMASTIERSGSQLIDQWLDVLQASDLRIAELAANRVSPNWRQSVSPLLYETFLRRFRDQLAPNQRIFWALGQEERKIHFNSVVMTGNKCFFRTENGYFGTAPDPASVSVNAGDKVAVVSGLAHPMLLRPVDGGYKLLTHIYLHGIMYGEAWPDNDTTLEELVLV